MGDDTNNGIADKFLIFVEGLAAAGVTEQEAWDCLNNGKPTLVVSDAREADCGYAHCVGEEILIF